MKRNIPSVNTEIKLACKYKYGSEKENRARTALE